MVTEPDSPISATTALEASAWQLSEEQRRRRIATVWGEAATRISDGGETCTVTVGSASASLPPTTRRERRLVDGAGEGDFHLRRCIGRGGMAMVYEAVQNGLGRTVAVKVQQGEHHRDQFLAEASLIALLEHPHVVPIYEVGSDPAGGVFYAMRRIEGDDWSRSIDRLDRERNIDILLRVADAVAHAHGRGVLHCDLKPGNVLLGHYGEVLLIDWGMAMMIDGQGARPIAPDGGVGGTPAYMAPEQALVDPRSVGPWTDIYLLGGLLFRLCTGRRPHHGRDSRECIENASLNRIVAVDDDDGLVAIALRAMADDPEERFPDVGAFQEAIRSWRQRGLAERLQAEGLRRARAARAGDYRAFAPACFALEEADERLRGDGGEGCAQAVRAIHRDYAQAAAEREDFALAAQLAPPDDEVLRHRITRGGRRRARRQGTIRLLRRAAVAALALAIIILAAGMVTVDAQRQRQVEARAGFVSAIERMAREQSGQLLAAAAAELADERRVVATSHLERVPTEDRGWAWRHLDKRCQHGWQQLDIALGTHATCVAVSPDERLLAAPNGYGKVGVWSISSGSLLHTPSFDGIWVTGLAFTADGRELVVGTAKELLVYDTATGARLRRWDHAVEDLRLIDDRRLVVVDGKLVRCLDLRDGDELWSFKNGRRRQDLLDIVDDVVLVEHFGHVVSIPIDMPTIAVEIDYRHNANYLAAHAHDGGLMYFVTYPNGSCGVSGAGSPWLKMTSAPRAAAFSPDGSRFAISTPRLREVLLRSTFRYEEPRTLRLPSVPHSLRFIDGGRRLVVGMRESVGIFDLDAEESPALPADIDWQRRPGGRADATVQIAERGGPGSITGHANGSVRVWHPELDEPLLHLDCGAAAVEALAWSGDDLLVRLVDGTVERFAASPSE